MKETLASQQIEAILSANWESFKMWQGQNRATRTFDMSQSAAQVFIPRRILELSEDPKNVHALLSESSPHSIGVVIFERFNKLVEERKGQMATEVSNSQATPEILDNNIFLIGGLLKAGKLTFNDRVFIHYRAKILDGYNGATFTINYMDRKEFQRKGIGGSFYQRLETVLRELEFKYLIGNVISPHPEFFERQRIRYRNLPDDIKSELPLDLDTQFFPHNKVMVKVL